MMDKTKPTPKFNTSSWALLGFSALLISLSLAFEVLQIRNPSDAARLQPGDMVWHEEGVVITPLMENHPSLQPGDLLLAVDGRSIESWLERSLQFLPRPERDFGDRIEYTIQRGDQIVKVFVELRRLPVGPILSREWGALAASLINLTLFGIIFLKSPRNPASGALFLASAGLFSARTWSWGLQVSDLMGGIEFWLYQFTTSIGFMMMLSAALHFVLVFPRPMPILRRKRWILALIYLTPTFVRLTFGTGLRLAGVSNTEWMGLNGYDVGIMQLVYFSAIIVTSIVSYRSIESPTYRKQVRWIIYAITLIGLIDTALYAGPEILLGAPIISSNVMALVTLIATTAILIAVFRHHLFDIDLVINRTMVYGLLSATLALIYFAGVTLLEGAFRPLTAAGEEGSRLAVVTSTLSIAALFSPLRQRFQTLIDRRFYRRKYDADQTLAAFSQSVRNEVKLSRLSHALVQLVQSTMQPTQVSLWMVAGTDPGLHRQLQLQGAEAEHIQQREIVSFSAEGPRHARSASEGKVHKFVVPSNGG